MRGNIVFPSRQTLTEADWQSIVESSPFLEHASSCSLTNPMTGEQVEVSSPQSLVAKFDSQHGQGVLRMIAALMDELEFEGGGRDFEFCIGDIAKRMGGEVNQF